MAKFRMPYPDKVERMAGDDFTCEGPSLTLQSEAESCDINWIVDRYHKTGVIEHVRENVAMFVDLPPTLEYQDALGIVKAAGDAFAMMPAEIRAQFNNSAAQFLQFADANEDYLEKLGIVPKREEMAAESAAAVAADPGVAPGQLGLPGTGTADVPPKK